MTLNTEKRATVPCDAFKLESGMPASPEAERTILGAVLLDNHAFYEAAAGLRAHDFSLDSHQRIFARMGDLIEAGRSADIVTLPEELRSAKELDAIGGATYLTSLIEGLPRRLAIGEYVRIVKQKSDLRQLIHRCTDSATEAADQSEDPIDIIGRLQGGLEEILDGGAVDSGEVERFIVEVTDKFNREREIQKSSGYTFGLPMLDEFTGGMRDGEITVVGARPGVGKTSLACQCAAANCRIGVPVHMFSLEMTRTQILQRLISIESGVPYVCIRDAWKADPAEAYQVQRAAEVIASWPLRIHDNSELQLTQICALSRISIRRHNTRVIVLDFAQEVDAPGKDERTKVIAVCRGLARMIKHERASLMLLSALVKIPFERYGKPPVVGDLTESGKIESVAHLILLLHRGYEEETKRLARESEIYIPKARAGDTGVIAAAFNRRTVVFE